MYFIYFYMFFFFSVLDMTLNCTLSCILQGIFPFCIFPFPISLYLSSVKLLFCSFVFSLYVCSGLFQLASFPPLPLLFMTFFSLPVSFIILRFFSIFLSLLSLPYSPVFVILGTAVKGDGSL